MSHLGFRRICTVCCKPVGWEEVGGPDNCVGRFFHLIDRSSLCEGASVDLETKEFPDELTTQYMRSYAPTVQVIGITQGFKPDTPADEVLGKDWKMADFTEKKPAKEETTKEESK